jgi:hypothetical protein
MAEFNLQHALRLKTTTCISCGVEIAMPADLYDHRLKDRREFFCPNGHSQHFIAETEEAKLRRQLDEANRRLEFEKNAALTARQQLGKANKAKMRLQRRIKAGVCPCCQRTVRQLAQHMATKHPDYAAAAEK